MATKSQLKQYFETGKIPTQAQFGELIDFIQPFITDNVTDRPNQTLLFGGDTPNPIINGLRIIHYYENDETIYNYWIFTNEAGGNNLSGISIPMFVIKRISSEEPNLSLDMPDLEYAIPTREQLTNWIQQGYDCDTADADTLHSALTYLTFKPWSEGGGSEFPRVAYIDGQSAWDTWYNNFKTAHPESGNSGSPILNQRVIDGYTFIIEISDEINFYSNETLEFVNCTIINNDITNESISMNFTNCVFRNCHIDSGYLIQDTEFDNCICNFDARAQNCTFNNSSIYGVGLLANCTCGKCNIKITNIDGGTYNYTEFFNVTFVNGANVIMCKLFRCTIESISIKSFNVVMICCISIGIDSFDESVQNIRGFIWGCDFSSVVSIPGVMEGVQCCKFKSTLLSSGAILADLFGNKNAATNGMNTGV
jgi:hypothetical protein